jgi:peptidoglycan/LPS O-acetylase OafA/YrhL
MVLIVFYHTDTSLLLSMPLNGVSSVLYQILRTLMHVAVPLFFIFSGYLFFRQPEHFTRKVYRDKLERRIRTLLIPYLIWNFFAMFVTIGTSIFSLHPDYFIDSFVGIGEGFCGMPKAFQLWFLRDLMLMCLLSLPLYYLLRGRRPWILLLFALLYVYQWTYRVHPIIYRFPSALLFFSVGAYMGIHKMNIIETVRRVPLWASLTLTTLIMIAHIWLIMTGSLYYIYAEKLFAIVAVIPTVQVASLLVEHRDLEPIGWLAGSTFLLYAVHPLIINYLIVVPLEGRLPCTTFYFWIVLLAEVVTPMLLCAAIHAVATRLMPRTAALLTGGRAKSRNI